MSYKYMLCFIMLGKAVKLGYELENHTKLFKIIQQIDRHGL